MYHWLLLLLFLIFILHLSHVVTSFYTTSLEIALMICMYVFVYFVVLSCPKSSGVCVCVLVFFCFVVLHSPILDPPHRDSSGGICVSSAG